MNYGDEMSELYYDISDMFCRMGNYFTHLNYRNRYFESERKLNILRDELIDKIDNIKKLRTKSMRLQSEIDNMVKHASAYLDADFESMLGEDDAEDKS